jgi:non-specific serine/threonine protein kinase
LQAAHDAGVLHRDVKPGNILICEREFLCVKLSDFGVGQVTSDDSLGGLTRAGFTLTLISGGSSQTGTHVYMAPELYAGKPASIRSDVYSLGILFYQLLVGDFSQPLSSEWSEQITDPLLQEDLAELEAY